MGKQIIVYEKESGVITQVMSFNDNFDVIPESLQLEKKFDLSKIDFLLEEPNVFINIKKDRVFESRLLKTTKAPPLNINTSNSDSLFENVDFQKLPEHVAMITPWNRECGISNYSHDLIDNIYCKISVFCGKDDNLECKNPNIKVIPCWTNRDSSYGYLVELLKKQKIDVAHVQYNHDLMNAGELKKFAKDLHDSGIRSIITLHSSKGGVDIYGKVFDEMIVHNKISADDVIGENVKKKQVKIIPIGTKKPFEDKTKKIACIEKNIDYNRPIISNFGFFLPQKGIKEQIKTLRMIKTEIPNILLLVVCAIHKIQNETLSEKYYNECKNLVDELDLKDNVIFITDYLDYKEVFDYLHCSDVVVLPYINSAAQATSSAGRTALISMRPVITTDVEIFSDLDGIVPKVKARNITELSDKIIEILNDKKKQEQISKNIENFIRETSWENISKEHMRFYKSFGDIKIDIEGQVYSYFSASVVNRNLACALDKLGVDVSLQSINLAENKEYELGDGSAKLTEKNRTKSICVRHQYPPNFNEIEAKTKIVYLQAETSVPDEWVKEIESSEIDFIWAYTNHAKDLIRKSGVTKTVEVIKCGYDEDLFNDKVYPADFKNIHDSHTNKCVEINDDTFVFLFVGHAQERKNFKAMFKAYLSEFTNEDNVLFVIKSYDGGEIHKIIEEIIDYVSEVMEKQKEKLPKYLYIYEDTDPKILPSYYKAANVMLQCSRAEGFGKPIVEAMALGIPSISVLWSGPKDFCTEKNSFPVPYTLVKSTYHVQSEDKESYWANTKIEDLRKTMRFCSDNPEEVKKRGEQALIDSEEWSTEVCAFEVIKFIRKYNLV